jgi:hypothetical protein
MALTQQRIPLIMTSPVFMTFLGYLVIGQVPQEISDLVDQMSDDDIPPGYQFIAHMWQNRNRDPKMRDEIVQYIQQKVKETMP